MKLNEKNRVIGVGMCVLVFLLFTTLPSVTHAGIPEKISYQGYLTDAEGVPVDGLVEMVFSWPGLGKLMVSSVLDSDYPVAQAAFLLIGVFVVLGNLVADILYGILDPRIRYR